VGKSIWSIREEYYFDFRAARNAVRFFEREIYHIKGPLAGTTLKLERWQRRIVRRVYGWKCRDDNTRKYRTVFIFVPRKNGKSSFAVGFALYGLLADGEAGAEVVSAARDREQASLIFDHASLTVEQNPRLKKFCSVYKKSITTQLNGLGKYTVLSSDVMKQHGLNPSTVIFDELHTQPNGDLVEVLETATHARAQPLTIYCTTAGHDYNSVCYETYDTAKKILAGEIEDPTFMPVIFEAPRLEDKVSVDWENPEVWKLANPNYGVSIIEKNFKKAANEAKTNLRKRNSFLRLHLNVWTQQEDRWIDMEQWQDCGRRPFSMEEVTELDWYGGIDLSSKKDLTSFVLTGVRRDDPDSEIFVLPWFWLPKDSISSGQKDTSVTYSAWASEGHLRTTPGATVSYPHVVKDILEICKSFKVREIGFDPYMASELSIHLDTQGFKMVEVRQGFGKMNEPCMALEGYLADGTLRHNNHPILNWQAGNVAVETASDGRIRIMKGKSKDKKAGKVRNKVDGIVAMVIGLSRLIFRKKIRPSRYETEGLDST
jgi:phage terminase large subunit-like protein